MWRARRSQRDLFDETPQVAELRPDLRNKLALLLQALLAEARPEFLTGRADVAVALVVIGEVISGEGAVGALGFVEHRNVRLDSALMHQPSEVLGRTVGRVGRQPLRP